MDSSFLRHPSMELSWWPSPIGISDPYMNIWQKIETLLDDSIKKWHVWLGWFSKITIFQVPWKKTWAVILHQTKCTKKQNCDYCDFK